MDKLSEIPFKDFSGGIRHQLLGDVKTQPQRMMTLLSRIAFLLQRSVTVSLKVMMETFSCDPTDFVNVKHVYVSLKCSEFWTLKSINCFLYSSHFVCT